MLASYHVHSCWSDGQGSFDDYIRKAKQESLQEIGFSDHFVFPPQKKKIPKTLSAGQLENYLSDLERTQKNHPDIPIRKGLEVDFFPETIEEVKKLLEKKPFDYLIGSIHCIEGTLIDHSPEIWGRMSQKQRDEQIRKYWKQVRQMAESKVFDIIGHLDLYKKFGFAPSIDLQDEILDAIDAISLCNSAVEFNTAGWYFPCAQAYPSPSILKRCLQKKIPLLISSDAHCPENLTRDFQKAKILLQEMGFSHLAFFEKRKRTLLPF
jgi:histidinol-phosphatase (PHP family)